MYRTILIKNQPAFADLISSHRQEENSRNSFLFFSLWHSSFIGHSALEFFRYVASFVQLKNRTCEVLKIFLCWTKHFTSFHKYLPEPSFIDGFRLCSRCNRVDDFVSINILHFCKFFREHKFASFSRSQAQKSDLQKFVMRYLNVMFLQ